MPGAYATCRSGSSGRTWRASACPMRDLTEDRGVGGKQYALPGGGGGEEWEDVRGPRRGGEHDVGRVRPREWRRGERDHSEAPSGAMAEEPD